MSVVSACNDEAPTDESPPVSPCREIRERIADLQVADLEVDREKHRAAFVNALGDRFLQACDGYDERVRACLLDAQHHSSIEACLPKPPLTD